MSTPLARFIRQAREAVGLTPRELGVAVGRSESMVSRWESGKGRPVRDAPARLVKALRLTDEQTKEFYRLLGGEPVQTAGDQDDGTPPVLTVKEVILADEELLPEAKTHLLRQYDLLRRIR